MVKLKWNEGTNEILNGNGLQLKGSKAPDQQGLSPKEMLEGAVALCLSITLEKVLERDNVVVNLNELEIDVRATKQAGVENRFTDFNVDVAFPSTLEEAYKKKLLKVIERGCTISNTLIGEVNVEVVEK